MALAVFCRTQYLNVLKPVVTLPSVLMVYLHAVQFTQVVYFQCRQQSVYQNGISRTRPRFTLPLFVSVRLTPKLCRLWLFDVELGAPI